jgi:hypothetical protein
MNSKIKKQIIEKYILILNEYFQLINNSSIMKEIDYPISYLYIGINSIHRVFEHILLKTQSIEKAYYYCQKTYYYYLEYMSQIYKSNILLNLNHMDAVLFVYKKTIFNDVTINDDVSNTVKNIMTLDDNSIIIDNETEIKSLLLQISKITNTIFHWENTEFEFNDRLYICENYLHPFMVHSIMNNFNNTMIDLTLSFLEIIQEKSKMNYIKYDNLLKEILLKLGKIRKTKQCIDNSHINEMLLTKYYIDENSFLEKLESDNLSDFINWLY